MKLDEIVADRFDRGVIRRVRDQIKMAGATELGCIVEYGVERDRTFYVALDSGLYIGTFVDPGDGDDQAPVTGELTPWSEVSGARLLFSGFPNAEAGMTVTVKVAHPEIDISASPESDQQKAFVEFGHICMTRGSQRS